MQGMRIYYGLYLPLGRTRTLLDAMRFFARPASKQPAHITVRGPYDSFQDPREWNARLKGEIVSIRDVGAFFGERQNTVFYRVESTAIRELWHKPDYPEGIPHLTVYDGDSTAFAEALLRVLDPFVTKLSFVARELEPMVAGNGPPILRAFYDPQAIAAFLTNPPTLDEVDRASDQERLDWIATLAEHFAGTATCAA